MEELDALAEELRIITHNQEVLLAVKKTIDKTKRRLAFRARGMSEHSVALLLSLRALLAILLES